MSFDITMTRPEFNREAAIRLLFRPGFDYRNARDLYETEEEAQAGEVAYVVADGFELLGEGLFSKAYTHPEVPGYVLKVSGDGPFNDFQDLTREYLDAADLLQGSPCFPKVLARRQIGGFEFYWMPQYFRIEAAASAFPTDENGLPTFGDWEVEGVLQDLKNILEDGPGIAHRRTVDAIWKDPRVQRLMTLGRALGKLWNGRVIIYDIHDGNVMWDHEAGEFVLTDPSSGEW